ncbi:precorrin-6y C5,15-methyltransferase (decarboxylating) subunit CbiE [Calditerrivibrio nitroreducens]|uniref:Precorrin-6y C5,15-methyltransferase (Decarboxylating), CbiE subunit n=1 Tax=Calditerrivibrio nitroreducens (strain DSM 19672 / NBRC 101217 / Yu37-1) TaxID=768670 RepID=E4TKE2_CALNY|nr:precorrin-6y C5,15-methyltransferase (decarboxylating) subunit CbiE [Calditerrivibrio nitroreducens]ADR20014.1 precorrin-6y C5,15-methyltransferase (decarboxylating), CbiE subunit [Calditerrivibrio nitroreducens DSM 19672]
MNKNIYIISAGCGSKDYLTLRAFETAKKVDFLIGAERFKDLFPDKKYIILNNLIKDTINILENEKEKIVGVVVSGDAGFFSLAKIIYKKFKNRIIEVIPGISSMQLGMARMFKTYESIEFFSLHGRNIPIENFEKKIDKCLQQKKDLYVLDDKNKQFFELLSRSKEILSLFDIYILNNLGLPDETIYKLKTINDLNNIKLELYSIYLEVRNK